MSYKSKFEHNDMIFDFKLSGISAPNYGTRSNWEAFFKFAIDNGGRLPTEEEIKNPVYREIYGFQYMKDERTLDDGSEISNHLNKALGIAQEALDYMNTENGRLLFKHNNPSVPLTEAGLPDIDKDRAGANNESELNPYIAWQEQQRARQESQELGLLNQQTRMGMQNAEISAQQSMIQQAQFKNDLVEQIKLDRMSKMRQGISPMQIAQENLQFMVGNMQQANQQMSGVTQSRLAATQQSEMNPYQAYLNSVNSQAYQANAQLATGMAATDASDLYMQAMKYARSQGRNYLLPTDYDVVSRTEVNKN